MLLDGLNRWFQDRSTALVLAGTVLLALAACDRHLKPVHQVVLDTSGVAVDGGDTLPPVEAIRQLQASCANSGDIWSLRWGPGTRALHLHALLTAIREVDPDCRAMLRFDLPWRTLVLGAPVPWNRSWYSLRIEDTTRPFLGLTYWMGPTGVQLQPHGGIMPPLRTVLDTAGREWIRREDTLAISPAWVDQHGRCLVLQRTAQCADTILPGNYVLSGDISLPLDDVEIGPDGKIPRRFQRTGQTLELSLAATIQVLRTLPGSLGEDFHIHAVVDSSQDLTLVIGRLAALREAEADLSTIELD